MKVCIWQRIPDLGHRPCADLVHHASTYHAKVDLRIVAYCLLQFAEWQYVTFWSIFVSLRQICVIYKYPDPDNNGLHST